MIRETGRSREPNPSTVHTFAAVRADSIQVAPKISSVHRPGHFSPLTLHKTLVVDRIVASCYYIPKHETVEGAVPFLSQHDILHLALSLLRMMACMLILHGQSSSYNNNDLPSYLTLCFQLALLLHSLLTSILGLRSK